MKFALGELSPKELRGETIGDLIHRGPQTVASRSAYVAVQFDNHDRRIPIDAEAVTISREFRRGGEGIYRLNGRRISRKQLTDILSSADINVSSYNIVPQHAITKLAEVTTEERRRIIEDMVGIAVYDTRKASAQAELQQADLNLQVASAKIDEVRLRVEGLEKERNDYLKYQGIRNEITQLEAKAVSYKINKAREESGQLEQETTQYQLQLHELKNRRDELIKQKSQLESEKREFEESTTEKNSSKLLEVQKSIGDVSAKIASLEAQTDAMQANIKSLERQKNELQQNSGDTLQKLTNSKDESRELRLLNSKLEKAIESKQSLVEESAKALSELREKLGENSREAETLDQSINSLTHRVIKFNAQIKASATKIDLLESHLRTLRSRKEEYEMLLRAVTRRMDELNAIKRDEETHFLEINKKIAEYTALEAQRGKEMQSASDVARRSKFALIEIETQKNLAENLSSEENALKLIEEMATAGAVSGIYGRLGSLVRVNGDYAKAIEAAAAGWMKALVVKNMETAVACVEILKKTKVGRVKLIPLEDLTRSEATLPQEGMQETLGPITNQLTFQERFRPAVHHVFGDTILTASQKPAFLASLKGVRAVAISGDLYEPGGAMETGYFRHPFDVSRLLLRGQTVEQLKSTLSSLEQLVNKAKEEIARLEQEILDQTKNRVQTQNLIWSTGKEIVAFTENLERARKIIEDTDLRTERIAHEVGTERATLQASASQKGKILTRLSEYERARGSLKLRSRSAAVLEKENEHSKLAKELDDLVRQRMEAESRIQSLLSAIDVIEPSAQQTKIQISSIEKQLEKLSSDLKLTRAELSENEILFKKLHAERDHLSEELAGVKVKRSEFDARLGKMEAEIDNILNQLDPLNNKVATSTATLKQLQMQIDFHMNQLKELGPSEVLDVSAQDILAAEETLPVLKKELTSIGGINELAVSQYEEVKENYKHLASRIYELEKEKMSIIEFMNELDRQKLETFMRAFNQVSVSFNEIFSTVTGGVGRLYLEKPESPFEGGSDIRLQFPGKTEMTIGSASGGEKSVGTVCFILALQAIHPMPFYMMDEIDAHLDVVNSQRLAELLKAKSKGSQFIIVSLKDVTITRGDTVYGVFIQDGVSQVVGLPMQEVKAAGRAR